MVGERIELPTLVDRLVPALSTLLGDDIHLIASSIGQTSAVRGDPAQLEQVLIQLGSNARDAMPGGGRLTISIQAVSLDELDAKSSPGDDLAPGDYVLLSVSDTGTGMDRVTLSRAFEPFFTTKPFGQATGLGLAMVHGIVKQHGGHVWATSEPGQGSTIRVYLPAIESRTSSGESAASSEPEHVLARGGGPS
jgi:signal transduction histidine kinase